MKPIIMPGTAVYEGNEPVIVGAVGCIDGERYYWLTYVDGSVSMMPADVVEKYEVV